MRLCLLLLITSWSVCSGYKILGFFPFPATSHQNAIAPILHRLASRGHQVVYLTPVQPKISHPNLELRLIKPYIKEYLEELDVPYISDAPIPLVSHQFSYCATKLAHLFYNDPVAQSTIHGTEKFDAVMMESHLTQEPVTALIHKFGCVGIEVATMGDMAWLNELSGVPDNPAYQIDFKCVLTDTMTFTERLWNFYALWATTLVSYYHLQNMQVLMDKYFNYTGWERRPPITQLVSNKSIILINQDVLIGYPYPLAPNAIRVGGANLQPRKPLPKDIQKFMDEAHDGFILFSLGSILKTSEISSNEFGKEFLRAFDEVPYKVLMKWENDSLPQLLAKSKNIMTLKWLPQQDILAQNNCKLFITHGGYQSLSESVNHGVPIVGIPFFADQPKNVMQAKGAGYGVMLRPDNVTYNSIKWALNEVLYNPRYRKEAKRRSEMMKERRHSGLDEAAHWVEFGIKYPNALTPRSANLTFIQLHQIDIFMFIFSVIYLTYKLVTLLLSVLKSKPVQKEKKL